MNLRIKEILKENNLTIESLAEKAGVAYANVSKAINGKSNPSLETLEKIALALDAPIQDLFAAPNEDFYGIVVYKGVPRQIDDLDSLKRIVSLIESEMPVSDSPK